jgi:hypothetical protein
MFAAGVVEVLARSKNFDPLCARATRHVQQARMKTLIQK